MRRLVTALTAGLAASAVAVLPAVPASAAVGIDLSPNASPVTAKVGDHVTLRIQQHNYGTVPSRPGEHTLEIKAPGGTEFDFQPDPTCTVLVAKQHIRCLATDELRPVAAGNGGNGTEATIRLVVRSAPTTPGFVRLTDRRDVKPSNDSATLTVNVSAAPKPSPSTKATPVTASPPAEPATTAAEPDPTAPASSSPPVLLAEPVAGDGSLGGWLAFLAFLLALGASGILFLHYRTRPAPAPSSAPEPPA